MSQRVRIKDIAKRAGVSKGTVDRVLHDRGNVSKEAMKRVLAAMKELDYEPNQLARVLANNKTWKIATLLPHLEGDCFWERPDEGIDRAIEIVKDYGVDVDKYHFDDDAPASFVEQCKCILEKHYDAVLVAPIFLQESHAFFDRCEQSGIKYAQLNTYIERKSQHFLFYIGQDSYHSGVLGAKLLNFGLSEGETALILHLEKDVYNAPHLLEKERGFEDYFSQLKDNKIFTAKASFPDIENRHQFQKFIEFLLKEYPKLKGVFVTTSRSFHLVEQLEKMGVHHLKLVAFDLIEENLDCLKNDKIDFLVNQNPIKQGYIGIMNLMNYFVFDRIPPEIEHLPLDIVMKENFQYYLFEQKQVHRVV
ncbi:MAG: LacI family DNA-binding transcriptional regulator [Bacteroidota bacterium]